MTLPIRDYVLDSGLDEVLRKAKILRHSVQTVKAQIDTNPTSADQIISLMYNIKTTRDILATVAVMPGLLAYARTEFNDPGLDIVTDLNTIITACDTCLSWIAANFPKDVDGYLLKDKIVNGKLEARVFQPAVLSGFSTQLTNLLAAFS